MCGCVVPAPRTYSGETGQRKGALPTAARKQKELAGVSDKNMPLQVIPPTARTLPSNPTS